jgi:hypothetical protein
VCVCSIECIFMENTSYKQDNQKSYHEQIINVSLHLNKQYHRANSGYDILLASLRVFCNVLAPHWSKDDVRNYSNAPLFLWQGAPKSIHRGRRIVSSFYLPQIVFHAASSLHLRYTSFSSLPSFRLDGVLVCSPCHRIVLSVSVHGCLVASTRA